MASIFKREGGGHSSLFLVAIILTTPTILVQGEEPGKGAASFSNDFANTSHNVIPNSVSTWVKNAAEGEFLVDEWTAPYEMRKGYPYYLAGHDYDGRPIWVVEVGKWNFRKIVEAGEKSMAEFDIYMKQISHQLAKSIQDSEKLENPVSDFIFIMDMEDFSFAQMAHVPTVVYLIKTAREYLGFMKENAQLIFIINTNAIAQTFVTVMRPGNLMEKIEVYGTQRAKWQPLLLKHIPRNQIPEFYGGTKDFKPLQVYG